MRTSIVALVLIGFPLCSFAQSPPCAPQQYGFDPYKPSDLAIMRQLGGTALAHAPLTTLLELDPYVPIQGELLRQLGGAIPIWALGWYPAYPLVQPPDCRAVRASPPPTGSAADRSAPVEPPITAFADLMTALDRARAAGGAAVPLPSRATVAPSERNRGVWLHYAGRMWVSAGSAVAFSETEFERIGESAGSPIFRRRGSNDDVIYLPTTAGVVAPFQATAR